MSQDEKRVMDESKKSLSSAVESYAVFIELLDSIYQSVFIAHRF